MTAKFVQPDFTTQDPTAYKGSIDAGFAVAKRIAMAFAPHAQDTPDMSVRVDAGQLFDGATLTEVAAQSTGTITAPVSDPRIDRVVIDAATGVVSVITGSENASPSPPSITAGKLPVAQVLLQTDSAAITNSMITDERTLTGSGGFGARTSIASASTVNLATVASHNALITGTTGIASFGPSGPRTLYLVEFEDSLTLTDGADLDLGGTDITTAAGDLALFEDVGSGQWRLRMYWNASHMLDKLGATQGMILYRGAGGWIALSPGTAGQYLQTQGAVANPQWAAPPLSRSYTSPDQTITVGGTITLSHGLGGAPAFVQAFLKCTSADLGYAVNDVVPASITGDVYGISAGMSIILGSSTLVAKIAVGSPFWVINKSTNATEEITPSKWKLIIKAWA